MPEPDNAMRADAPDHARLRLVVRGAVQGVGFRPFVYRLSQELALPGWVNNSPQGVSIEVEGPRATLQEFLLRLEAEKPAHSRIQSLEPSWLDAVGFKTFEIRPSDERGQKSALVLPDIATCADCRREIFDPTNRRYRYPFTNCTHCGPRFSIIESLPYDRGNTSMKRFRMCPQCQAEYHNPLDRRFHAQPNACPVCGPHLDLWNAAGHALTGDRGCRAAVPEHRNPDRPLTSDFEVLRAAAAAIRQGRILAVKGLGGFHLMVAAHDDDAIRRLRELKHREEKPLALMFPSLEALKEDCETAALEERLLRSPEAPIVLLRRKGAAMPHRIAASVAPRNPHLGAMLPYTPLHHLLLTELGFPVVATSGNLSDEPICTDEREAVERLHGIADLFLVHDRPIVRHVDDSIARVSLDREMVLRRARGYAPLPIQVRASTDVAAERSAAKADAHAPPCRTALAVGAHLKNAVALAVGPQIFVSQHIGDLENAEALSAFRRVIDDLQQLYEATPESIAADMHPDYLSTKHARATGLAVVGVQHHYAHVLSCMAENDLDSPVLGVSWDGTGYGLDQTIWGGEFLRVDAGSFRRVGHLRTFRLPGGDRAVKEPRRVALGLLYELFGDRVFDQVELAPVRAFRAEELAVLRQSLARHLNAPVTSSVGRLFDAVAGIVGLRQVMRFEGQAAMELEFALDGVDTDEAYEMPVAAFEPRADGALDGTGPAAVLDWAPLVGGLLADVRNGLSPATMSAKFHNALVEGIVAMARRVGETRVVLTGGCFQNKYLAERAVRRLRMMGFRPYWHQRVPPNDGGIALGQAVAVLRAAAIERRKCV